MTQKEKDALLLGLLIGVLLSILSSWTVSEITSKIWEEEAKERGYAQHNTMTGKWEWIEPETEEQP